MRFLKKMFGKLNQRGVIHLLPLLLILLGIIGGVYLVQKSGYQIFKPKAAAGNIEILDGDCVKVDKNGKKVLVCERFQFKLNSPLETGQTTDAGPNISLVKTAYAADNSQKIRYCGTDIWADAYSKNAFNTLYGSSGKKVSTCVPLLQECREYQSSETEITASCFWRWQTTPAYNPPKEPAVPAAPGQPAGGIPVNISPTAGTLNIRKGEVVTFKWQTVANADHYRLLIDSSDDTRKRKYKCDSGFDAGTFYCADYTSTKIGYVNTVSFTYDAMDGATYTWWVDALDENGAIIGTSDGFQITIHRITGNKYCGSGGQKNLIFQDEEPIKNCASEGKTCRLIPVEAGEGVTAECVEEEKPAGVGATAPVTSKITPSPTPAAGGIVEKAIEAVGKIVCKDTEVTYGQCGGTIGLENEDPTHEFEVTKVTDCRGNPKPYLKEDRGFSEQCQKEAVARGAILPGLTVTPPQDRPAFATVTPSPTLSTSPSPTSPAQRTIRTTKDYRYAFELADLGTKQNPAGVAQWYSYTPGVIVSAVLPNTILETKSIFVQFRDNDNKVIEANNGLKTAVDESYVMVSIDLVDYATVQSGPSPTPSPTTAVTITPIPTTECPLNNWQSYSNESLLKNCSYQQLSTLPVSALIGFSNQALLNMANAAGGISFLEKLPVDRLVDFDLSVISTLSCSKYTLMPKYIQDQISPPKDCYTTNVCTPKVTTCSCDNPDPLSSRYPGKCYPDCNGGWCKGGICDTCKP